MLRVSGYVKRFISNLRRKHQNKEMKVDPLNAEDIKIAENEWVKDAQATLEGQTDYNKYKKQLGVVSNEGILVCQGRMDLSDLAETAKKPILFPKNHKFSELIILDCHERVHHCKERATLAELRARFWITKGRQYVKRVINSCFICKRLEGKPLNIPPVAPLPDFRLTEAPPFNRIELGWILQVLYFARNPRVKQQVYTTMYTLVVLHVPFI